MLFRHTIQPLERWIDEFQFTGRRRMSEDERAYLAARLGKSLNLINASATLICALLCVGLFTLAATKLVDVRLFGPLLAVSVVFVSIVPLQWSRQLQSYRENLADIQVGEVEIFRTAPSSTEGPCLVYLPRSGRLLSENGVFARGNIYLTVNGIALRPQNVNRPFPHQVSLLNNHVSPVRTLSLQEKQELAALLPKNHGWKWLLPLTLWCWCVIGLAFMFQSGYSPLLLARLLLLATAAFSLSTYYRYRAHRLATVRTDLKMGTVVCEYAGSYQFEQLVNSHLLWTVDSRPASWRKRSISSWFCPSI
jgi:hypothetical protein